MSAAAAGSFVGAWAKTGSDHSPNTISSFAAFKTSDSGIGSPQEIPPAKDLYRHGRILLQGRLTTRDRRHACVRRTSRDRHFDSQTKVLGVTTDEMHVKVHLPAFQNATRLPIAASQHAFCHQSPHPHRLDTHTQLPLSRRIDVSPKGNDDKQSQSSRLFKSAQLSNIHGKPVASRTFEFCGLLSRSLRPCHERISRFLPANFDQTL